MNIDEIKEEMCDGFCKYLAKANRIVFNSPDDIDELVNVMHDVCANCPLSKLEQKP